MKNQSLSIQLGRAVFGIAFLSTATLIAQPAHAEETAPSTAKRFGVGALLLPMPAGSLSGLGGSSSQSTAFAFGFAAVAEYQVMEYFSVGVMPKLVLNVKGSDASKSGTEIDLLLRAAGWYPLRDNIKLYAYLAPGYSMISIPDATSGASGLALGFGGGGQYKLTDMIHLMAEIGYQLGFQTYENSDYKANYFHIGLGAGTRF